VPAAGRVTAGTAGGLRLVGAGPATRPLSDRVKQALFGGLAGRLVGARVLDLFAGTGAAGIEALSRGAAWADFVDHDDGAVAAITANLRSTGLTARGAVHRADVIRFLGRPGAAVRYDLVIVDPPYGDPAMLAALERLGGGALLVPEAIVVAKHFWRDELPETVGLLRCQRTRRFGETALTMYRRVDDGSPAP